MTDKTLISRIRSGELDNIDILTQKYYDDVYRYCVYRSGSLTDAEDLTQETFLRLFKYIDSYREKQKFKPYLLKVASNVCTDYLNQKNHLGPLPLEEEIAGEYDLSIEQLLVKSAVCSLPHDMREVIIGINSDSLNNLVGQGEWTIDRLLEFSASGYTDSGMPLRVSDDGISALAHASDIMLTEQDKSGLIISNSLKSAASGKGKIADFCSMLAESLSGGSLNVSAQEIRLSNNTPAGFAITTLGDIMEYAFSVNPAKLSYIPLPKYNSAQTGYHAPVSDKAIYYAVTANSDGDKESALIRYFAASSSDIFTDLTSFRYTFDESSTNWVRLMADNITFERARLFETVGLNSLIPSAIKAGSSCLDILKSADYTGFSEALKKISEAVK